MWQKDIINFRYWAAGRCVEANWPHDIGAVAVARPRMMVIVSLARRTIIHLEKRVLALDAKRIHGQAFHLAHQLSALLQRPEKHAWGPNALHQHPSYAVRNVAEGLQRIVRLLEAVLVVDVEIPRHRRFVGVSRVNGMMICERKEVPKELLDHCLQLLVVEWLERWNVTAKRERESVQQCLIRNRWGTRTRGSGG